MDGGAGAPRPADDALPDDREDTLLGSRRADELEDTVLGSRRVAELEDTVLGSRRVAELEDTVLGSRRAAELEDTVLGSRRAGADAHPDQAVPLAGPIVGDTTAALGATQRETSASNPKPAERAVDPAPFVSVRNIDDTITIAPARRSTADDVDVDAGPRRASTPDQAILKAPYRPREISTDAPPARLPEPARPPLVPADAQRAERQQQRRSNRALVTVLVAAGVVVVGGLTALAGVLVPLLVR